MTWGVWIYKNILYFPGFDIRQIIYPSKKCKELEDEELHKAYVLSHKSYFVGKNTTFTFEYNVFLLFCGLLIHTWPD